MLLNNPRPTIKANLLVNSKHINKDFHCQTLYCTKYQGIIITPCLLPANNVDQGASTKL